MGKVENADTVAMDIKDKAMLIFQCPREHVEILHVANVLVICNLHVEPVQRVAVELPGHRLERLLAARATLDSVMESRRL
jgi:hypothetical protein